MYHIVAVGLDALPSCSDCAICSLIFETVEFEMLRPLKAIHFSFPFEYPMRKKWHFDSFRLAAVVNWYYTPPQSGLRASFRKVAEILKRQFSRKRHRLKVDVFEVSILFRFFLCLIPRNFNTTNGCVSIHCWMIRQFVFIIHLCFGCWQKSIEIPE